jgi:hypothetical protein
MEQAWQKVVPVRFALLGCIPFIQRFYRGRCADVYLLGPCLTLTGCFLMLERSGSPARPFDPRGTEADLFNVSATTQRTLGLALERLAEDAPVPLTAELAKLAVAAELAALDGRRGCGALRRGKACPRS